MKCWSEWKRPKYNILVFTRIGPVFSGNARSASRVVNCNLTCVEAEMSLSEVMMEVKFEM